MKKIINFLIILLTLSMVNIKDTYAISSFYEAEYVPSIWLNKYNPNDNLIYYHQARLIRQQGTNQIAYCLEPFTALTNPGTHQETINPTNYTKEQIEYLTLIAHFGYGYKNHTELKWYAITQMLIWKTAYPNAQYYYTASANGQKINFTSEEQEIYNLIEQYQKDTSFNNQTYTIVEDNSFTIIDTNNALKEYTSKDIEINPTENAITIPPLKKGNYLFSLEKNSNFYNKPILFYQSPTTQDVITIGDPQIKTNSFNINVINTTVNINKIDKENLNNAPQGDGILYNSKFALYTNDNQFIQEITLNGEAKAELKNLNFGTYYLKETAPGTGYKLNTKKHYFTLSTTQQTVSIRIKNEIIKGKLKIYKEYGCENNFIPEPNISFNIYKNDILIQTIITDSNGIAEITLPYGKYSIIQLTTTEGYQKIEPQYF